MNLDPIVIYMVARRGTVFTTSGVQHASGAVTGAFGTEASWPSSQSAPPLFTMISDGGLEVSFSTHSIRRLRRSGVLFVKPPQNHSRRKAAL